MKKTIITLAAVAVTSTSVFAAGTAACKGCHGQEFEKKAMGKSKVVKDMSKDEIVAALKGYKDGSYGGAMKGLMAGQVKSLDDAAIEAIATEIAGGEKKEVSTTDTAVDAAKEKASASMTDAVVDAAKEKATEVAKDVANSAVDAAANKAKEAASGMMR
jgi:cytochrome c-type protein NapB